MVILSSTITISIGFASLLIILIIAAFLTIFIGINVAMFQKYEKMTKYKNCSYNKSYRKLHICLFYCGLIFVPLFKKTIRSARHLIALDDRNEQIYSLSTHLNADHVAELMKEQVSVQRGMKLLKLKYKKKSFVVRKIFTIFVSK